MTRTCGYISIMLVFGVGCSPKGEVTRLASDGNGLADYLPVSTGNSWTYGAFSVDGSGTMDTSWSGPSTLSIFQTNALIGGQPNAFIVQTVDPLGTASYMAFHVDATTLWHYIGVGGALPFAQDLITWDPGGYSGTVVAVNRVQTYLIADPSGGSPTFSIVRPPDPAIATAVMTARDSLQITGVTPGQTMLTLMKSGGTPADTMALLVGTSNSMSASLSTLLPPWIPLYMLTRQSSGETLFSRDTTFTFRRMSDSATCTDRMSYMLTNRYVGDEVIPVLNSPRWCERIETKLVMEETITIADSASPRVLFSGPSMHFVVDTWLLKGVGFVKISVTGNARPPVADMEGDKDENGVLNGYYISPRITYAALSSSGTMQMQIFHVDNTPLDINAVHNGFILMQTNF